MKNFKNYIAEEKKKYTREEMESWCYKNIKDYRLDGNIEIFANEQKIVKFDDALYIKSNETLLPDFKFEGDEYLLECPNLKSLNLKQFLIGETRIIFKHTDTLNYNDIIFPLDLNIFFDYCKTIHPNIFTKNRTSSVNFNCPSNQYVTDFSFYGNSKIFELRIAPYQKFKNMTDLFIVGNTTEDFLCGRSFRGDVDVVYSTNQITQINHIMYDYIRNINKHEYVMDFTVDMSDAGFEDEL